MSWRQDQEEAKAKEAKAKDAATNLVRNRITITWTRTRK